MSTRLLLEGPNLTALLDQVAREHGKDARIVSAEKLRKGGVMGFFAQRWFEITVEVPDGGASGSGSGKGSAGQGSAGQGSDKGAAGQGAEGEGAAGQGSGSDSLDGLLALADRADGAERTPVSADELAAAKAGEQAPAGPVAGSLPQGVSSDLTARRSPATAPTGLVSAESQALVAELAAARAAGLTEEQIAAAIALASNNSGLPAVTQAAQAAHGVGERGAALGAAQAAVAQAGSTQTATRAGVTRAGLAGLDAVQAAEAHAEAHRAAQAAAAAAYASGAGRIAVHSTPEPTTSTLGTGLTGAAPTGVAVAQTAAEFASQQTAAPATPAPVTTTQALASAQLVATAQVADNALQAPVHAAPVLGSEEPGLAIAQLNIAGHPVTTAYGSAEAQRLAFGQADAVGRLDTGPATTAAGEPITAGQHHDASQADGVGHFAPGAFAAGRPAQQVIPQHTAGGQVAGGQVAAASAEGFAQAGHAAGTTTAQAGVTHGVAAVAGHAVAPIAATPVATSVAAPAVVAAAQASALVAGPESALSQTTRTAAHTTAGVQHVQHVDSPGYRAGAAWTPAETASMAELAAAKAGTAMAAIVADLAAEQGKPRTTVLHGAQAARLSRAPIAETAADAAEQARAAKAAQDKRAEELRAAATARSEEALAARESLALERAARAEAERAREVAEARLASLEADEAAARAEGRAAAEAATAELAPAPLLVPGAVTAKEIAEAVAQIMGGARENGAETGAESDTATAEIPVQPTPKPKATTRTTRSSGSKAAVKPRTPKAKPAAASKKPTALPAPKPVPRRATMYTGRTRPACEVEVDLTGAPVPDQRTESSRPLRPLRTAGPAPAAPALPGQVLVVAGELEHALDVANAVCRDLRIDPSDVLVAGPTTSGHRRVASARHAAQVAAELHAAETPSVVVVQASVDEADGAQWAAEITRALGASAVWAVVDATRKSRDLARHVRELGDVVAMAVHGAAASADPTTVLELGLPIVAVDGKRMSSTGSAATALADLVAA
ncbi:hypothetical protein [Actinosynnema sp.]|uniref:hypothetical protein n=1 Tax=Actinosynnema sp. TaxID=1872144 RepID=UPI003F825046